MKDYRLKDPKIRKEYLVNYFGWSLSTYDCDPSLFLMNYVFDRMEFNIEQRFWMSFLYANSYNLPTSWVLINEFPDFENVDIDRVSSWWRENNDRIRYQRDKLKQKNKFIESFVSYKSVVDSFGGSQEAMFNELTKENPRRNFKSTWEFVNKNYKHFGRYTVWFYLQTLKVCCGVNIDPEKLFLRDSNTSTQRSGLYYSLAMDDIAEDKKYIPSKDEELLLESYVDEILRLTKQRYPTTTPDRFYLETTLCAFKKTFRKSNGRYLGYYLDRQYEDIKIAENDGWDGIEWDLLWQGRDEMLIRSTNRKTGVLKEEMVKFLDTGIITNFNKL